MFGRYKRSIIFVAILAVLAAILRWAPPLAAEYAMKQALTDNGFEEIALKGIDVNIYTARVAVQELQARRGDGQPVKMQNFALAIRYTPFAEQRLSIESLILDGLDLQARQDASGTIYIGNWPLPKAAPTDTAAAENTDTTTSPWLFGADSLEVRNTRLGWQDPQLDLSLDIASLTISELKGWTPDSATPISFDGKVNDAPLTIAGTIQPFAAMPGADLAIRLDQFDLRHVAKLAAAASLDLRKARISLDQQVTARIDLENPVLRSKGTISLADTDIQLPDQQVSAQLGKLDWVMDISLDSALAYTGQVDLSDIAVALPQDQTVTAGALSFGSDVNIAMADVAALQQLDGTIKGDLSLDGNKVTITMPDQQIQLGSFDHKLTLDGALLPGKDKPLQVGLTEAIQDVVIDLQAPAMQVTLASIDLAFDKIDVTDGIDLSMTSSAIKGIALQDQQENQGILHINALGAGETTITAAAHVDSKGIYIDGLTVLPEESPVASWQRFTLDQLSRTENGDIHVGNMILAGLQAAILRDKDGNMPAIDQLTALPARFTEQTPSDGNNQDALVWDETDDTATSTASSGTAPATTAPAASSSGPDVTLGSATLEGENSLSFRDESVTPHVEISLDQLLVGLGAGKDLIAPREIFLTGRIGRGGSMDIKGMGSPNDLLADMAMEGKIKTIDLYRISPYVAATLGRNIKQGLLSNSIKVSIKDRQLDMQNALFVEKLDFDSLDAAQKAAGLSEGSLPIDLAVSVLSDSDGNIRLDLPVTGDLDNPQFDMSDVIATAMGKAITGAAAATLTAFFPPTALLALGGAIVMSVDDSGTTSLPPITFDPGSSEMTSNGRQVVTSVSQMLESKQDLRLQFCPLAVAADEAHLLGVLTENELFRAEGEAETLRQQMRADGASEEDIAAVKANPQPVTVDSQLLAEIAQGRADAVYDAITQNDSRFPDRLIGCRPEVDTADTGDARVSLSL